MWTVKTDQTGRMPMLIWDFAGRTGHFVGFVMLQLIFQKTRGKKRKYFPEKKPNLAELKWYKKQENLQHYSDVGYLAKQLETADDVYSKIIEDRENSEFIFYT